MSTRRRDVLKALGASVPLAGVPGSVWAHCKQPVVQWRNWSGAQSCVPHERVAPASEGELAGLLRRARRGVRPVGSGHSFSALVPTDDTLVSLGRMQGLIGHDPETQQAEFRAGTLLSQVGEPLEQRGLALTNMPDIDYQSLAGAYATSTHGTGIRFGSLSTQITGLRLVTAQGEVIDCDARSNPDIFNAARVSLGSLGVATRFRLQCRTVFRLREHQWLANTDDILDDIDRHVADNRHFEMQVLVHSDYALAIALNETDDEPTGDADAAEESGAAYLRLMHKLHQYGRDVPSVRRALTNLAAAWAGFEDRVGASYRIFANIRNVRFNEMEYQVPAEAGPDCLREILATIEAKQLPTFFPIEYRYVAGDDIWLSQFHGRDSVAISIHQHHSMSYHGYFDAIEPIFWKYEGRPHWGKLHSLNANSLKDRYRHWRDFLAVREALDPEGKFLNGHLRDLFGL